MDVVWGTQSSPYLPPKPKDSLQAMAKAKDPVQSRVPTINCLNTESCSLPFPPLPFPSRLNVL